MDKNIKKILSIFFFSFLLMNLFLSNVNAFSNGVNLIKINLFKAVDTGYKRIVTSYKINDINKNIMINIKANPLSKNINPYWEFKILKLKNKIGSNFDNYLSKELISKGGISYIGRVFLTLDRTNYKKNKEEDIKEYNTGISYKNLSDGINYFTVCGLDSNFIKIKGQNIYKCTAVKTFYFDKKRNKIIDKTTFESLYDNYKNNEDKKIEEILKKINSFFDENKIKKSRFHKNSKIKTHQELQKLILSKVKKEDFNLFKKELKNKELQKNRFFLLKIDHYCKTISSDVLKIDDNGLVLGAFVPQFPLYVKATILKYLNGEINLDGEIKKEENNKEKNIKKEINIKENGNCSQVNILKKENEINRKKAISFSKNLLSILNKISTKQKKLEKIDYLFNLLDTTYSPEKFKNQDLIKYVKDYLSIVQYAVEIGK